MSIATRDAYGKALAEMKDDQNIVVLDADLSESTRTAKFAAVAPERFFDMGISEADMIATAAGLASCGKVPFCSTFAVFLTGRAIDQIRNSVCYPNMNVKLVGTHAGVSVGEDGGTHQAVEDIALMRALPNMSVIVPSDDVEARAAVLAAAELPGPMYLRMGRYATPTYHSEDYRFELGKAELVKDGTDCTIIATGMMVIRALDAAKTLEKEGIHAQVVNMHTIKPLDEEMIVNCAKKTGRVVTAEEGTILGGLGSAVCEVLCEKYPVPVKRIGMNDVFGESGEGNQLMTHFGLTAEHIAEVVRSF